MKLIAKAKPVKIRIKSGNEEHSSLESLRKNFVWEDIRELLDGSLQRWLQRIGANDIVEKLAAVDDPKSNILSTYNILFRGDSPFASKSELFNELPNDLGLIKIAQELISDFSVKELLQYANKYVNSEELLNLLMDRIILVANSYEDDFEDAAMLYEMGIFLNKQALVSSNGDLEELASKCFDKSSKKGNIDAKNFIFNKKDNLTKKFWNFYLRQETKEKIEDSWTRRHKIDVSELSGFAKNLFEFSNTCLEIFTMKRDYFVPEDYYTIAIHSFGDLDRIDPLYEEKMFVLALLNPYFNDSIEQLRIICDYAPAQYLLEMGDETDCYKAIMLHHNFEIGFQECNKKGLKKFVTNLYGMRNYGKTGK